MRLRALFGFVLLGLSAACGAAPMAKAPAPMKVEPTEPEPTTIEEAQAQIERARAQTGERVSVGADQAPPAAPPGPTTQSSESGPSYGAQKTESGGCVDACRAIASMRRAVGVLCRLAGEDDARCTDAKKTLGESERRVARCGC